MWQKIIFIVGLLLLPTAFLIPRIVPIPDNVGRVEVIGDLVEEPIPHRVIDIIIKGRQIHALADTTRSYDIGDQVTTYQEGEKLVIGERYRTPQLISLAMLFAATVLIVSGFHGLAALVGLLFSFAVIFRFVLPQIVAGSNPILVALLASILILIVSYFLSHGISSKSIIAIIGTFGALIITGTLAIIYGKLLGLTGMGAEETGFLLDTLPRESFYKLLLAGMIIGSLGVLDDITISQAAIVAELKEANHRLRTMDLFSAAMRIGHDHIASLVNTLVLVYAGSAMPLLLLFVVSQVGYGALLNYEALAEEIVRTLVASIGLIAAVPLTTIVAAYWYGQNH